MSYNTKVWLIIVVLMGAFWWLAWNAFHLVILLIGKVLAC